MLIRYSISYQREISRSTWAVDLFLDMALPHEKLVTVLEELFSGQEPPFIGSNRRLIAESLVHVVRQWYEDTARAGGLVFGGEENVAVVDETLRMVLTSNILDEQWLEEGRILRLRLEQILR